MLPVAMITWKSRYLTGVTSPVFDLIPFLYKDIDLNPIKWFKQILKANYESR